MNLYRKKNKHVKAFFFTGPDSIPPSLRYENNKNGIMPITLNTTCRSCFQSANKHGAYLEGEWEKVICPGLYVIYDNDKIIEMLTPQELKESYIEVEVEDAEENTN